MQAYSMDLRTRVMEAVQGGKETILKIAARFRVSARWIHKLRRHLRETESLEPKPHAGGREPIVQGEAAEKLRQTVLEHPELTLQELREHCGISGSLVSVWRALKRLDLSHKKKRFTPRKGTAPKCRRTERLGGKRSKASI